MEWQKLKDKIYFEDGSLRDIYVHNVTLHDWKLWIDYVNRKHKTSFHIYDTERVDEKISIDTIAAYFQDNKDFGCEATVYVGSIIIKTYFFIEEEIENDISPKDIQSLEDHYALLDYMQGLSNVLNKKVVLTPENMPEVVLIAVESSNVVINLN